MTHDFVNFFHHVTLFLHSEIVLNGDVHISVTEGALFCMNKLLYKFLLL